MSAPVEPCYVCKGTRHIVLGGGPYGPAIPAPCFLCNMDGKVPPQPAVPS